MATGRQDDLGTFAGEKQLDFMFGELIPSGGGDPIPLLKQRLVVGRRPTCDICLPFPNVSSQHCELEFRNGYWHVQDLNSSNGIKINGVREESRFLHPGDELTIAKHAYEVAYEPAADAPPPPEENNPFSKSLLEKAGLMSKKRRPRPSSSGEEDLVGDAPRVNFKKRPRPTDNPEDDQILGWLDES
ncbi:FHA domain-containing protein [Rubinisphaera margarita]|uniref:FHA domain-containing protein n=1 Tax=Rubinisphaera margarita TaxID=2909586 RepID=UPI001EE80A81|nr:FHA domain-containing protein [Rubinisphaera margarita]MCG6157353.1 FHA domain-containing protein [Rubinisphaera margarita]